MAAFFSNQLDFILFFYGLAFILLGAVVFAVSRASERTIPWPLLGTFAYLHGAGEWFDLLALIVGESPSFALFRTVLMVVSFIALFEFGRMEATRCGLFMPARWIYVPLLALIVFGWHLSGTGGANVFARYVLAFPAASLASILFAIHSRQAAAKEKRWLVTASIAFGAYGLAAGIVVPSMPDWSGDFINYDLFAAYTGMPVQFVRGVLACLMAFSIWAYWGQRMVADVDSALYTKFYKRQFAWTLSAMATILVLGWVLTEVLGGIYKTHVQAEALGDINLIISRLAGETATTEAMVKALAGSRSVGELAAGNPVADRERIGEVLTLETVASGANEGFILDRRGIVLAAVGRARGGRETTAGQDLSFEPYFKAAIAGYPGYHFTLDASDTSPNYIVSFPIRAPNGVVTGAAVLRMSLARFETDMESFDRSFAMVDGSGVVVLTNRADVRLRMLWPLPAETRATLAKIYGVLPGPALMKEEIFGAHWTVFDNARDYVQRRALDHGDWSLITWKIPQGIFASRVVGIFMTLLMAIMALIYLVGRDRWMHDNVQLKKRFELEELARTLDNRAATDPLTGLYNRRKFDRSLAAEIKRAQRYRTQLSLMLFDVDHFKKVNDDFGHQVGDAVLTELSHYCASHIRESDVLARWGGEEFVILSPGSSGRMACLFADNLRAGIGSLKIADVGTITCSFGVADFQEGDTGETLLARADDALYRAKNSGRNRVELAEQPQIESPETVPTDEPAKEKGCQAI